MPVGSGLEYGRYLLLYQLSVFIIQRCIKIGASFTRQIFFKQVSLKPDGLAGQVNFLVEMNMNFFLRKISAVQVDAVLYGLSFQARRKNCTDNNTAIQEVVDLSLHRVIVLTIKIIQIICLSMTAACNNKTLGIYFSSAIK